MLTRHHHPWIFNLYHSSNNTFFIITHINKSETIWLECNEPLLVWHHVVRTNRVNNPRIYIIARLNTHYICFTARIIYLNHIYITRWTLLSVWIVHLPMPNLFATITLNYFLIFGFRHLLSVISIIFVLPAILSFFQK